MVKEVTMPQLATYEDAYFFTNGNGVDFIAPVNGRTTPGSSYPRCELRQMKPNGEEQAWSNANRTWTMTCTLAFIELPGGSNNGVVGMQIHGGSDDVTVLRCDTDGLWVTKGDNPEYRHIDPSYTLGTVLNMKVVAQSGGGFVWYRDNVEVARRGGTVSGAYFKAGCYTQANTSNGSGRGRVRIYSLQIVKG